MSEIAVKSPKALPLYIPETLRKKVEASAEQDRRKLSPQILVLVEEALEARERKAG